MRFRAPHPAVGVLVELASCCRLGHHVPVRDVLTVTAYGQRRRVTSAWMRTVGCLHDREDPMARDLDAMTETFEVIDDAFGRRDHSPLGCPATPYSVEQRFGEGKVARRVGHRGMDQCHVRRERLQHADLPERVNR